MRAMLTSIAGRVYLTQDSMADQRQAAERLKVCEALALDDTRVAMSPPAASTPFPTADAERALAEAVRYADSLADSAWRADATPDPHAAALPHQVASPARSTPGRQRGAAAPRAQALSCHPARRTHERWAISAVFLGHLVRGMPAVAITDELSEKLDAFFTKYAVPFPAIVAVDELRRSFLTYGVSGPPTFVLADAAGKV
jgi:hypothetical protein